MQLQFDGYCPLALQSRAHCARSSGFAPGLNRPQAQHVITLYFIADLTGKHTCSFHSYLLNLYCIVRNKTMFTCAKRAPCFPLHPLSYYLLCHLARPNRETFCSFTPSCRLWSVLLSVTPVTMLPSVSQSVTSTVVSAKPAAFIFLSYCLSLCSSVNTE